MAKLRGLQSNAESRSRRGLTPPAFAPPPLSDWGRKGVALGSLLQDVDAAGAAEADYVG